MSDYITNDLLALILKSLPVKTLIRYRIVCKSWKELIDSKSFILKHLALQKPRIIAHNQPFEYLIIDPHTLPMFDTLSFDFSKAPIDSEEEGVFGEIICSVHGVVCIKLDLTLLLWNPSIHRMLRVPLPDCHELYMCCGFWIDPSNNDWKIVMFCNTEKKIVLYSSTNPAWREVAREVKISWGLCDFRQVLINGVGHWNGYNPGPGRAVIAYFDFLQDKFGTIDVPNELVAAEDNTNVYKWQHSLSILHWRSDGCTLWLMKSGSWNKMITFSFNLNRVMDVLCVEEENGGRILAQTAHCKGSLVLYDPNIRHKHIRLRSEFIWSEELFSVSYEFVESLVFPNLELIPSD